MVRDPTIRLSGQIKMKKPRVETYLISLRIPGGVHHHGDLTVAHVKILRPFCHSRIH
jgi:hypothetical protein